MKILDRGYWISLHFYWQSMFHYLSDVVRFKSFTYFTVCNPAIDLGGMLADRKTDIYDILPDNILPLTQIITSLDSAKAFISTNNLNFPLIIKPNVGIKGYKVEKIANEYELAAFIDMHDINGREWIIQEYLDQPHEYSLLFYKAMNSNDYGITSFIEKKYPYVTGDGRSTLKTLIDEYKNPFLERESIHKKFKNRLATVPILGEQVILDYIGNYGRGAKFYSLMDEVDSQMTNNYFNIFERIDTLNFFRIDLKANSLEDVKSGRFKVLEVNGMKSEPLHIYDPNSSFLKNVSVIKTHWQIIRKVVKDELHLNSVLPTLKEGLESLKVIKKMVK